MHRFFYCLCYLCPGRLRSILYRLYGFKNCKKIGFMTKVWSDFPCRVRFSDTGFVNRGVEFHLGYGDAYINIGENVWIAPNVQFYCVGHEIGIMEKRAGKNTYASINVGDGVWIGANSTILQGVKIGNGAIVAAGSLVNKDIPDNEMWGGVPAKRIKSIEI